jgi:hypothetical protein
MVDERTVDAVLLALGAGKPLFRRWWVPERVLSNIVRDRRDLADVLEFLARDPEVRLRARGFGKKRQWLLERGKPKGTTPEISAKELIEVDEEVDDPDTEDQELSQDEANSAPLLNKPLPRATSVRARSEREQSRPGKLRDSRQSPDPAQSTDVRQVLRDLGIAVTDTWPQPKVGPSVIRHYPVFAPGARIESLRRCLEDISRAFGCEAYISNLPGERFAALDLARRDREVVPLMPAIEALPPLGRKGELWLPIGMTPDGTRVALDLSTLPHLLIAGSTGSGKSIWLLCMMLALVLRMSPEEFELILIDIKAVDFACLAGLPHLRAGEVISDVDIAIAVLQQLTGPELEERTDILRQADCANLSELQSKRPGHGVKRTVVVIDELGDLITILSRDERREFEREVLRLAQRARAVGIHLVIATQRPTREFITGATKANLPCRIAFRLPQRNDSAVILDQPGAERLLGLGDMLLLHNGRTERLQAYYAEVRKPEELVNLREELARRQSLAR